MSLSVKSLGQVVGVGLLVGGLSLEHREGISDGSSASCGEATQHRHLVIT